MKIEAVTSTAFRPMAAAFAVGLLSSMLAYAIGPGDTDRLKDDLRRNKAGIGDFSTDLPTENPLDSAGLRPGVAGDVEAYVRVRDKQAIEVWQ